MLWVIELVLALHLRMVCVHDHRSADIGYDQLVLLWLVERWLQAMCAAICKLLLQERLLRYGVQRWTDRASVAADYSQFDLSYSVFDLVS